MSVIELYFSSLKAIKKENEIELSYLYGQEFDRVRKTINYNTKVKGLLLRVVYFLYFIMSSIGGANNKKSGDCLFYSGSKNQQDSLATTMDSLASDGVNFTSIVNKTAVLNRNEDVRFSLSLKLALVSTLIFLTRFLPLYFMMRREGKSIEIKYIFNVFCYAHVYIPYFFQFLSNVKGQNNFKMVIMANDHNVDNRSLRLVAEILNIETLYMQHASVSDLFPPLKFDYALLDGEISKEIYLECAKKNKTNNLYKGMILLSGQKKKVIRKTNSKSNTVGLALNSQDNIENVLSILEKLTFIGREVEIRVHPSQKDSFLKELLEYIGNKKSIAFHNPLKKSLVDFFSSVNCIIAGNTSIHIEAALFGLPTIYYSFDDNLERFDYYGYVRNNISHLLKIHDVNGSLEDAINFSNGNLRLSSIRRYSATFRTRWENREGELSSLFIQSRLNEREIIDYFIDYKEDGYGIVVFPGFADI